MGLELDATDWVGKSENIEIVGFGLSIGFVDTSKIENTANLILYGPAHISSYTQMTRTKILRVFI